MQYRTTILENGVRIATREMAEMKSVSVGIWIAVGGRHEPEELCGISHFLEHLLFKGTTKRSGKDITEEVEGLGGFVNAFTTEDHTCIYAKAASQHLPTLANVLSDMYVNSLFAEQEIERERDVIREEILMYKDQPGQFSQELLTEAMWPRHALGRPLTGSLETVSRIQRAQLLKFVAENYNGLSTVVTVAGRCTHEEVVRHFRNKLKKLPRGRAPVFQRWNEVKRDQRVLVVKDETEQTHLALGYHAMSRTDDRRHAMKLLSVILGENMSSRLFQQLRERYAFCYSVHSGTLVLEDSGLVSICVGLEPQKLRSALRAIHRELDKLCKKPPTRKELYQAQEYTIGQNELGLESTTNQIMWMGESMIAYDKVVDPEKVQAKFKEVTADQIQQVANLCFAPQRMGLGVVGPVESSKVERWIGDIGF
ncbi:MAG: insulinase family protein [Verrucomicrobia bacterium]|nr:insulinase family protein [Verrucomicrobiota bacterium]MBV9299180.1 insulinase family protein [Verrucomicrobiota bacterium]